MVDIEGDRDFYLHTQTWSHRAIKIYQALGFDITAEKLGKYTNENYEKALKILAEL
jgi:ribosomal protein S18 acetylase RimI-like enzyme